MIEDSIPPKARQGARVVGALALVVSLGFVVLFAAPGLVGAEGSYVVLSDSMSPHIQAGDVVVIAPTSAASIGEGDVITYRDTSRQVADEGTARVTHRVVEVVETDAGTQFRTQGDANEDPDPELVSASQIVGEVWFHVPLIGHLVVFVGTREGLLLFVVIPSILLVANELYSLYDDAIVEIDPDGEETIADGGETEFEWVGESDNWNVDDGGKGTA